MRVKRLLVSFVLVAASVAGFVVPSGAAGPVQPGVFISTDVGGCTLSFIYDGTGNHADKVYAGTAAHCVGDVGDDVRLASGETFGDVAVLGDEDVTAADWALIEVRSSFLDRVEPSVVGHPGTPTGVTKSSQTAVGDLIAASGHGVGFSLTSFTREGRVGVLTYDDPGEHDVIVPLIFGDSGGPLLHASSGKAFGIVSRLCIGVCSESGPTVEGIIAKAAAKGFGVTLRTA